MAIEKCRECDAELSNSAMTCPKCGIEKPVKKTSLAVKLLLGLFAFGVLGQVINGGGSSSTNSDPTKPAKKEKLNACFMFSVEAAKEGTNNGPRDSPQYNEIYNAAFDRCLKTDEKPASSSQYNAAAALESCVMSGKCDDGTKHMLNRVGSEIYGK